MLKNQDFYEKILKMAEDVKNNAYAPYSNFRVGAVLLTKSSKVYTGCNIENSSYGLTICAERVAVFKAVSEGEREFKILVLCADKDVFPCGACLQVLNEFSPEIEIVLKLKKEVKKFKLKDLLPYAFKLF